MLGRFAGMIVPRRLPVGSSSAPQITLRMRAPRPPPCCTLHTRLHKPNQPTSISLRSLEGEPAHCCRACSLCRHVCQGGALGSATTCPVGRSVGCGACKLAPSRHPHAGDPGVRPPEAAQQEAAVKERQEMDTSPLSCPPARRPAWPGWTWRPSACSCRRRPCTPPAQGSPPGHPPPPAQAPPAHLPPASGS